MSRVRKYEFGDCLTPTEAMQEIDAGNYIMWHNKPTHPGWARGWRLGVLIDGCKRGRIRRAVITQEWKEKNQ